ncbi:hypothetical protein [Curtobacterium sp. MCBD17_040]|uniref:hypothetical protein n=1 Tax=Curtobacterium sp. MCBD17_040 TaxID=2175674 RepID=UPI000DA94D0D|nr:hypothetical protein [Curtobacterium sp. MCBD17_040]WIB65510.1 hypothetical protein DEI94_19240 [Curtobacterium sp. MCBD17_040]
MTTTTRQLRNADTGKPGNSGHFDGFVRSEADDSVDLTASYLAIDEDVDVFFDSPVEHPVQADVVTFEMGEDNIVRDAQRLAGQEVARMGLPWTLVEEVAGETIAAVYKTAATARAKGAETTIGGGFIRSVARKTASRHVDGHRRHEDSRGFRDWKLRVAALEAELGRHLTATEGDAVAEEIRDNWHDKNHRPSKHFHREVIVNSLDAETTLDEPVAADPLVADGSARAHRLADMVEEKDLTRQQARRQLWNVFAGEDGAPEAVQGSVKPFTARTAKRVVKDAVQVAQKWEDGEASPEETAALFAPFGTLDRADQAAVAQTILARPHYGHRMWAGALEFAANTDGYLA